MKSTWRVVAVLAVALSPRRNGTHAGRRGGESAASCVLAPVTPLRPHVQRMGRTVVAVGSRHTFYE